VLVLALMIAFVASGAEASDFVLRLPLGLQEQAAWIPDDNPLTAEKIALGKQLSGTSAGRATARWPA